jgi:hypothetical protein
MDLKWLLKSAAYAAHAVDCQACRREPNSNCGGVTNVDLMVAAAVLGAATEHIQGEMQREIQFARASIQLAREAADGSDR